MSDKFPNGNDKFVIQLMIGKKEFPITIRRDEEEVYRKAAKQINEKLNRYEQAYPNLEPERYTSVVMLDLAVRNLLISKEHDQTPYDDLAERLTQEIDELLGQR